ncbi:MAG: hypothetical protein K5905_24955 [Roseibium sp.]|uniref:hypothetical protein n=1 Tax=Roseibium sp. TaxID=1936156 RepID=UPI0026081E90|nr:hypothetical protein [Roseibium sp.]MCV0428718.1 hypothetical protein [Roseibium sp.]
MDNEDIKGVLVNVFPGECESVGPEMVDDLIAGRIDFERPEHGRRFDLPDLDTLKDALIALRALIDMFFIFKKKKKRHPTPEELAGAAKDRSAKQPTISDEEMDALVKKVIEAIDNRQPGPAGEKPSLEATSDGKSSSNDGDKKT